MIINTLFYHSGKIIKLIFLTVFDYTKYIFTGHVGPTQQLIADLLKLKREGASGSAYVQLLNAYQPGWGDLVLTITAQYNPNPAMVKLIKELEALGYTQRIATNADILLYAQQQERYPELFNYLDGGKLANGQPPWVKKPDLRYYQEYQHRYNADRKKTIIFIDNSIENVMAAMDAGMVGILFKNTPQLRKQLIELGIPLTKVQ